MQNVSYGIIIKNIRKRKGLTQLELANKIGLDKTTISAYEREKIMPPTDVFLEYVKFVKQKFYLILIIKYIQLKI